jgi:hypothetical protein
MGRFGFWPSEHTAQLERELTRTQAELKATRERLKLANNAGKSLGIRVIELESELRGIHWVLQRFFSQTPFWAAIQHFLGQEKGNSHDASSRTKQRSAGQQ